MQFARSSLPPPLGVIRGSSIRPWPAICGVSPPGDASPPIQLLVRVNGGCVGGGGGCPTHRSTPVSRPRLICVCDPSVRHMLLLSFSKSPKTPRGLGGSWKQCIHKERRDIQHLENIGDHYYTTLMNWRDNFAANREKAFSLGFDKKFIRTWEYYLGYSAALFKARTTINYQIVFARPGDPKLPSYVAIA